MPWTARRRLEWVMKTGGASLEPATERIGGEAEDTLVLDDIAEGLPVDGGDVLDAGKPWWSRDFGHRSGGRVELGEMGIGAASRGRRITVLAESTALEGQ